MIDPETTVVRTKIVGASPRQRRVIEEILAGIGRTELDVVTVSHDVEASWGAGPGAVGISAKRAGGSSDSDGEAEWHASILGQAFTDRSAAEGLPQVAWIGCCHGAASAERSRAARPVTAAEALASAKRAIFTAERYGATVHRLDVIRPNRVAFALVIRADDAPSFVLNGLHTTMRALDADTGQLGYDGMFVRVEDDKGRGLLENGAAYWVSSEIESCAPFVHSRPQSAPAPPPCPAEYDNRNISFGRIPRSQVRVGVTGASSAEEEAILDTLAGIGQTPIEQVVLGEGDEPGTVELTVHGKGERTLDWHESLLAESAQQRFAELGLRPIASVSGTSVDPAATRTRQLSLVELWDHAERMARTATKLRAQVDELSILEPGIAAFDVRLTVEAPAEFLRDRLESLKEAALLPDHVLGGVNIEISDLNGRFVWAGWQLATAGGDLVSEGARPELEGCTPEPLSRPPGYTEPRCPAD